MFRTSQRSALLRLLLNLFEAFHDQTPQPANYSEKPKGKNELYHRHTQTKNASGVIYAGH